MTGRKAFVPAVVLLLGVAVVSPSQAAKFNLDIGPGFDINWNNKLVLGAQMRLQKPNKDFIGKTNLNPDLCAEDACIALQRDNLEPHQRWMAAPGAAWQISDDSNLTHDQFDITSGLARWRSDLLITGGDGSWGIEVGWQTFYDQIHTNLEETRPAIVVEEGGPFVSGKFNIPKQSRSENGRRFDLRTANVFFRIPYFGGRELDVRIGNQHITWGEALFTISGSLNYVNPLNFNNFFRPGMDLDEFTDPVNMISLRTQITDNLRFEGFYQLEWEPYELPARGTLGSVIADIGTDAANQGRLSDDSIPLPFGKSPEDPLQLQRKPSEVIGLISDTALSLRRGNNRNARDGGQYGVKLSFFSEALGETEFGLFFANYHSRLPSASFVASDATCAAAEGSATGEDVQPAPFPLGLINFMAACGRPVTDVAGLVELLGDIATQDDDIKLVGEGFDALPLSTAQFFTQYPENIRLFGFSFNTTSLGALWTGELAYRPDQPFQVDLEDLFFAALQPLFPREELELVPQELDALGPLLPILTAATGLPFEDLAGVTFTDRRNALPDFVTAFRGGTPGEVAPGTAISGVEKFDYLQGALGATWLFGREQNLLWADQFAVLTEISAAYVPGLPSKDRLQLDSLATTNTHFSPGIEETGDALKLNPFATTSGFPTKLSWGYKLGFIFSYVDVLTPGLTVKPQLIMFHDARGITPGLGGNFQQGRIITLTGIAFDYQQRWRFSFDVFGFARGGDGNRFRDRNFLNVALSYRF